MQPKLDVVLINPGGRTQAYQRMAQFTAIETPVWTGLIATYLRTKGKSVVMLDVNAQEYQDYTQTQMVRDIEDLDPRLVAVIVYGHNPSATTQTMPAAGAICRTIRNHIPRIPIAMIGGHVAALPAQTLSEEVCDFVSQGEGPVSLYELIEVLTAGTNDYKKVGDLWYRYEGKPVFAGRESQLVWDLDHEMSGMAYDLMPMNIYRAHDWHCNYNPASQQPYASMYTTLGCPYHCNFCNIQLPFKSGEHAKGLSPTVNSYRRWSAERVVAWIDRLVTHYGIKNIKFADELFVQHRGHVLGVCNLLKERNYGLNIWCYARPDTVNDMQDDLKAAGVNWVCLGIESGTATSRLGVDKKFAQETIYTVVQKLKDAGIHVLANYIFGLPDDDVAAMQATLDLAIDLDTPSANFYSCMALPGTDLYQLALEQHLKLPDSWLGYSQHAYECLPMPTKYLSGEEVLWFRDEAWYHYFNSPSYLAKAAQTFGPDAVEYIKKMAAEKPQRKYAVAPPLYSLNNKIST